ncbi:hypothetical protein DQ238_04530 [Geodermatophilus sp. TF02-6]|uniref:hypothetical protein n=1 Tax=Geodermatophilus sp. TF02-6 TaxID=2250575 RepID=UPI000DEBE9F6|nr:hypothetical protein [Geodermatophilus sp. TF02-6]RBY82551.1 hypothetical protein DQ238_04530 [Geodermatophilus sp. TF02-6]
MARKKTHGQIIGEELQEGLAHIEAALAEAGRAAAEQLAPRVEAAREATGPTLEAAKLAVVPRMAAAAAVAAPAVETARDTLTAQVGTARDALTPRVEAARVALTPHVEAAREAAAPRVSSAVTAAQTAATRAAADLAPRVGAARKALGEDVVPRLTAAQTAALTYAVPKVLAARETVTPVLASTRESIAAGLHGALGELDVRRRELTATTAGARKQAAGRRRALTKKAAKAGGKARRRVGAQSEPRRWPWLGAFLGAATVVFVVLRRRRGTDDLWSPAVVGDGPVPSYREDPVPTPPNDSGKTVSTAQTTPGDATPPDTDLGEQPQQLAYGDAENAATPGTATTSRDDPALDTATASPTGQPQTGSAGIGSDADDERNPAS